MKEKTIRKLQSWVCFNWPKQLFHEKLLGLGSDPAERLEFLKSLTPTPDALLVFAITIAQQRAQREQQKLMQEFGSLGVTVADLRRIVRIFKKGGHVSLKLKGQNFNLPPPDIR
jgi:hypothetical protein